MSQFPLQRVTEAQLRQLCIALWSWSPCDDCIAGRQCTSEDCPCRRSTRLVRFFEHYKDLTSTFELNEKGNKRLSLTSHEDLFEIIRILRANPNSTRARLTELVFTQRDDLMSPPKQDQERAISLAVNILAMLSCSTLEQPTSLLEHGTNQPPWRSDATFSEFVLGAFHMTDHPILNDTDARSTLDIKSLLTAKKLMKRAGLRFRPTDNLRNHLKLDKKEGVVQIFHYTAFLKEHLRLTKGLEGSNTNLSISNSLPCGSLPRQLALECLDSIQKILFPISDPKSRSILMSLASTYSFDPDCLRFEAASIRTSNEKDVAYWYFGARLADLYEELQNPKPRGWIEKWAERKSGARHVMLATLIGVIIALFLGVVSLAVSSYQTWIGYQQWQHPVTPESGS